MTGLLKDEQIRNFTHRKATKLHVSSTRLIYESEYTNRRYIRLKLNQGGRSGINNNTKKERCCDFYEFKNHTFDPTV